MTYSLFILDRDGVINHDSANYITSPDEWHAIEGSLDAIAQLNQQGCKVAIATNQAGIGRGLYDNATLKKIHQKMHDELAKVSGHIDYIAYCPHHPDEGCACRKPKPALLLKISEALGIPLNQAIMIGDSCKDYQATQNAGCDFALVRTGNGEKTLALLQESRVNVYANLLTIVEVYCKQGKLL